MKKEEISKAEKWRLQTLVNRMNSDGDVARQYYTLANYVIDNYAERMETIQTPLLYLISHCLELSFKTVITEAVDVQLLPNTTMREIVHSHSLTEISRHILKLYKKLSSICNEEDKQYFSIDYPQQIEDICQILQTTTCSYRYAYSLDKQGERKEKGVPFVDDNESPNIGTLSILFNNCYHALCYASHIISVMYPEQ